MGLSLEFIKDRAVKTISAATQIAATWTWQEKSIADMQSALTAVVGDKKAKPPVIGQEELVSQSEQTMLAARGAWDTQLDTLHRWTVQGVGMARTRFRNDPAKLAQLASLTTDSNSRSETLAEALAWESAWASVDPAWVPMPANTLSAFKALRKQCAEDLQTAYSDARADWRTESGKLAQMGRDLEDTNEAWYADATRAFPAGTPEGDMIRGTIPHHLHPAAEAAHAAGTAGESCETIGPAAHARSSLLFIRALRSPKAPRRGVLPVADRGLAVG